MGFWGSPMSGIFRKPPCDLERTIIICWMPAAGSSLRPHSVEPGGSPDKPGDKRKDDARLPRTLWFYVYLGVVEP